MKKNHVDVLIYLTVIGILGIGAVCVFRERDGISEKNSAILQGGGER